MVIFDLSARSRRRALPLAPNQQYGHRLVVDEARTKTHKDTDNFRHGSMIR
jgi:hypothetical protein